MTRLARMSPSPVFNLSARARVLHTLDDTAVVLITYGTTIAGTVTVEARVGATQKHLCEAAMCLLLQGNAELVPPSDAVDTELPTTEDPAEADAEDQSQADADAGAAAAAEAEGAED